MIATSRAALGPFEVGHAARPRVGESVSGDAVYCSIAGDEIRVAVVDGLGHGPLAALAATSAVDIVARSSWDDLGHLMAECDRGLRSTRGAAVCLVRFRLNGEAEHVGVGNVALVFERRGSRGAFARPGIVGARPRTIAVDRFSFEAHDTLVVHTDGVSQKVDPTLSVDEPIERQASGLIDRFGKDHDDATVVIVHRRASH